MVVGGEKRQSSGLLLTQVDSTAAADEFIEHYSWFTGSDVAPVNLSTSKAY